MFIRDGANPQETGFALFYISQELPQTQRKGKGQEKMILIVGGAYQGKTEYAREHFKGYEIKNCYHEVVRKQLAEGKNPTEEAEKYLEGREKLVIISDETGYGLVPVDAFERKCREETGRVNCFLAGKAEKVIRVVCGIGTQIKSNTPQQATGNDLASF